MTNSAVCCKTMNLSIDAARPPTYARAQRAAAATEIPVSDSLQVWLDADFLTGKLQIGTHRHRVRTVRRRALRNVRQRNSLDRPRPTNQACLVKTCAGPCELWQHRYRNLHPLGAR